MPQKINWDDARIFLAVARRSSLTGAAEELGIGIASVSRKIDRLESALSLPLFVRHQTGYRLTDEGEALLPRAEALEDAAGTFGALKDLKSEAAGRVRLATAENLANPIIIPSLESLLSRHPRLTVEVVTDIATVNLHRRDADLAVRMIRPQRGNVTVRRIGTLGYGLYGSQSYVAARTPDAEAGRFDDDRFVGWSDAQSHLPAAQWIERTLRGRAPVLTTTTLAGQVSAAKAGLGMAVLPHFLARDAGLENIPAELGVEQAIWLVMHSDLAASRRVRVVADHLAQVIRDNRSRLARPA